MLVTVADRLLCVFPWGRSCLWGSGHHDVDWKLQASRTPSQASAKEGSFIYKCHCNSNNRVRYHTGQIQRHPFLPFSSGLFLKTICSKLKAIKSKGMTMVPIVSGSIWASWVTNTEPKHYESRKDAFWALTQPTLLEHCPPTISWQLVQGAQRREIKGLRDVHIVIEAGRYSSDLYRRRNLLPISHVCTEDGEKPMVLLPFMAWGNLKLFLRQCKLAEANNPQVRHTACGLKHNLALLRQWRER